MWPFKKKKEIKDIETDVGYDILENLVKEGWELTYDYDFYDKGIDFDHYELKRKNDTLKFDWEIVFNWTITGSEAALAFLLDTYSLKKQEPLSNLMRASEEQLILCPLKKNKQIEDMETKLGYSILERLLKDGWKITYEYGREMFDKRIDYDCYILKHKNDALYCEWDNWVEWTITGPESVLTHLAETFSLSEPK